MKGPFIIGLSELISNTEEPKPQIVISGEDLYFAFAFENHLYKIV